MFFWNGLWDAAYHGGNGRGAKVSILVFLEWPLGLNDAIDTADDACVSILVFLEWPLGQKFGAVGDGDLPGFQSLFFWNGLWDAAFSAAAEAWAWGFNPCFSGMAFGTRQLAFGKRLYPAVSILVFLEWPLGPTKPQNLGV